MLKRYLVICFVFTFNLLNCQVFSRLGISTENEYAYAVTADNSGNSYLGGATNNDGLIVKLDFEGNIVWQKSFYPEIVTTQKVDVTFLDVLVIPSSVVDGYLVVQAQLGRFILK